jgi:hypothetical protein
VRVLVVFFFADEGPKSSIHMNHEGVEGITGAEFADGKDGCIKAVRRQIGAGRIGLRWVQYIVIPVIFGPSWLTSIFCRYMPVRRVLLQS